MEDGVKLSGVTMGVVFAAFFGLGCAVAVAQVETIVAIRHAEKPSTGLGQLNCKGLNRALALPKVLARYGRPDLIYAPNPAVQVSDHSNTMYSYVRPLITIEPRAIALGMPVNAQIGFLDIAGLQKELTQPANAHALIFVAWEHLKLNQFAQQMVQSYGKDPSVVPDWPNDDYDRIYIFKITQARGKPELTFTVDHEHLDGSLSDRCPTQ
jgi:hypothetical protein